MKKSYDQLQMMVYKLWVLVAFLISMCFVLLLYLLIGSSQNEQLEKQLESEVKVHKDLTIKYESLDRDVVSGSCLLRSQL